MYNDERLVELPIPIILHNNDFEDASFRDEENSNASQFSCNDQTVSSSTAGIDDGSNKNDDVDSSVSESTTTELATEAVFFRDYDDGLAALVIEPNPFECDPIKEEPEFELDEGEQIQFDDILADIDEQCDSNQSADGEELNDEQTEDEPILLDQDKITKFPMPMAANLLGLVKRENDPISGSLSFNEKVSL